MCVDGVSFSIARHAAWAPGLASAEDWAKWAEQPYAFTAGPDPAVRAMPPMLRRRAGFLAKMALEVAYDCLDGRSGVPTIFCSRHGEVARAVDLLTELARGEPLSPTTFGLAVHNASAGLFSIARADRANHIALAAGSATVEHAVIEACALLADGAPQVMLVAYDCPLPAQLAHFEDCAEQPHAFAWLMVPAGADAIGLRWSALGAGAVGEVGATARTQAPGALDVLRFHLAGHSQLERASARQRWHWTRHA